MLRTQYVLRRRSEDRVATLVTKGGQDVARQGQRQSMELRRIAGAGAVQLCTDTLHPSWFVLRKQEVQMTLCRRASRTRGSG